MTSLPLTALQRAGAWLRDLLGRGPLPVQEVEARAAEAGISRRTPRRARSKIGVRSRPVGFGGQRIMLLPEHAEGVTPVVAQSRPEDGQDGDDTADTAEALAAPPPSDVPRAAKPREAGGVRRVLLRRIR